jgi:hypothetical protein
MRHPRATQGMNRESAFVCNRSLKMTGWGKNLRSRMIGRSKNHTLLQKHYLYYPKKSDEDVMQAQCARAADWNVLNFLESR